MPSHTLSQTLPEGLHSLIAAADVGVSSSQFLCLWQERGLGTTGPREQVGSTAGPG